MKRFIPNELLTLLECWLSSCYSCVKWDNVWCESFHLSFGVREGSVLSPYLFAVYLDDLTMTCLSVPGVCIHCVFQRNWTTKLMAVTLSNLNRFSKFFRC